MSGMIKALWVSSRPGVIPSVFSNLMLGWCLGGGLQAFVRSGCFPWDDVLIILLGGFCFYLYGMWGNDFIDADWDARNRARRPVPLGMIRRPTLGICTVGAAVAGLFFVHSVEAVILVMIITLYNVTHKYWSGSVVFMGACRGMLVLMAAGAAAGERNFLLIPCVIALTLYVAGVTWWAREENKFPERIRTVGILLSWIPLWDGVWLAAAGMYIPAVIAAGLFLMAKVLRKAGARAS